MTDTDSLLNSASFPLQMQISGSKQLNSVIISATAGICKIGDFIEIRGSRTGIPREQARLRKAKPPRTSLRTVVSTQGI